MITYIRTIGFIKFIQFFAKNQNISEERIIFILAETTNTSRIDLAVLSCNRIIIT